MIPPSFSAAWRIVGTSGSWSSSSMSVNPGRSNSSPACRIVAHFRGATTMSPLQFQKLIRLQEARARILSDAGDVAAIGYSVGYDSPSQFSREYSRLFGAPPGRDKARLGMRATGT